MLKKWSMLLATMLAFGSVAVVTTGCKKPEQAETNA